MESLGRPRSTRDRPAKPPLSEDLIVETALKVLRAEGLDAVTMRRVATELDTGPASLYVYIAGRDELRRAMLDRVSGSVALEPPDPQRWRAQLHALLDGVLRALEAHPGIASVAVGDPPSREHALIIAENMLGLLLAGGVTPRDAAWACDILPLMTTAAAMETAVHQACANTPEETVARLDAAFSALPADRFPHIAAHRDLLISGDGDERFEFAIDTFLDGLLARAARA
ncbi:MAG: TetR/AcrR family transcriptional regulator [Solirubrobacteraceae bacterium]